MGAVGALLTSGSDNSVAFQFQKSTCVVLGTFNMYILHPGWLARRGIIEPGVEVGVEANVAQPGFRFIIPKHETVWFIAPNRLIVESRRPHVDCGSFVAKVLRALPETPLQGLGNNAHYDAELAELASLSPAIRDFPRQAGPQADELVVQRTFHVGVQRGEHQVTNLQIALAETGIELACNVHVALGKRIDAGAQAVAAAERFFEDRARSLELAGHFFGADLSSCI